MAVSYSKASLELSEAFLNIDFDFVSEFQKKSTKFSKESKEKG